MMRAVLSRCPSASTRRPANVEGTCVYTDEGHSTTIHYYKGSDGSAWDDGFGTAKENCEDDYDGTYSVK